MQPSQKSAALAASKWRKDTMVWCDMCKCYMKNHLSAIRFHEQGENHKTNLAEHLKAVKEKGRQAQKDNDMAKSMMGDIEKRARMQYESDISGLQRPEDIFGPAPPTGPKPPSSAQLQRAEIEGSRKELYDAVDAELKREQEEAYRVRVVTQAPQWAYDERTGYYSDATSGFMYDPRTEQYYNQATRAWSTQGPTVEGEDDEQEEYPLNPFSSGAPPPPPAAASQGLAAPLPKVAPVVSTSRPTNAPHPLALGAKQAPVAKVASAVAAAGGGGSAAAGAGGAAGGAAASAMQKATTAYMLGFGTNHPKYEAARAKTAASQQRVLGATGGSKIDVSAGPRGLGTQGGQPAGGVKRKLSDAATAKAAAKSKEEAEALARREAAKKRRAVLAEGGGADARHVWPEVKKHRPLICRLISHTARCFEMAASQVQTVRPRCCSSAAARHGFLHGSRVVLVRLPSYCWAWCGGVPRRRRS